MTDASLTTKKQQRSLLQVLLTSGLIASLSTALISYINSSFLETIIPKEFVGMMFSVAYFVTFIAIQNYARIIQKFSNHKVVLTVFGVQIASLLLLAWNGHPWVSLLAFITLIVGFNVSVINYDIFLEQVSNVKNEGRIRGMFWTAANLGFLLGPFLSGILSGRYGFSAAYLISAIILVPAWLMIFFAYRNEKRIHFKPHHKLLATLKRVHKNPDLRGIYLVATALFFFYSWMVIYTPIYLLESGFTWEQLGSMFTVMLIPFVLIEYPAGWLADRYFGETEMLTLGFIIMGIAVLALLQASTFWGVMLVLFCSRIGAALIEIMRDVYFYKKVNEDDLDLIDLFRNMRSVAYIVGPVLASLILGLGYGLSSIFLVLAIIMFAMTIVPFTIKDTL